jgi:hypothetical protein
MKRFIGIFVNNIFNNKYLENIKFFFVYEMEKRNIARLTQRLSASVNNLRRETERYRPPNNIRTGRNRCAVNYNDPSCIIRLDEICRENKIDIKLNIVRDD